MEPPSSGKNVEAVEYVLGWSVDCGDPLVVKLFSTTSKSLATFDSRLDNLWLPSCHEGVELSLAGGGFEYSQMMSNFAQWAHRCSLASGAGG